MVVLWGEGASLAAVSHLIFARKPNPRAAAAGTLSKLGRLEGLKGVGI